MNIRISWDSDGTWFPFFVHVRVLKSRVFYAGKLRLSIRR